MDRTPPTVTTSLGVLRGAWSNELAVFRGIPSGDELRRAWTDFALHGDPGWPAFTGAGGPTRLFGTDGPEAVPYPEQRSRALWSVHDLGPFRPEA
jgi:hypothetical protein